MQFTNIPHQCNHAVCLVFNHTIRVILDNININFIYAKCTMVMQFSNVALCNVYYRPIEDVLRTTCDDQPESETAAVEEKTEVVLQCRLLVRLL